MTDHACRNDAAAPGEGPPQTTRERSEVILLFPGQGSRWEAWGRDLYGAEPVFARTVERCQAACGLPLADMLRGEQQEDMQRTDLVQPLLYALQCALASVLRARGGQVGTVLGHSIGEYAAAHVAGMLELEEGARLVAVRGALMQQRCEPGFLAAMNCGEQELLEILALCPNVELVASNAARSLVVGGPIKDARALSAAAASLRVPAQQLASTRAFHTRMMEPMLDPFAAELATLGDRGSQLRFISSCAGREVTGTNAAYWIEHVWRPVLFREALGGLAGEARQVIVDVGPGAILQRLARRELDPTPNRRWLTLLPRTRNELQHLDAELSQLVQAIPRHEQPPGAA